MNKMRLKRKSKEWKFLLPVLLLAGISFHSCTDEEIIDAPSWHQAVEQGDNALMRDAKALVESTQGEMSMPDMFKTLEKPKTRAAESTPQTLAAGSFTINWEAAQSFHEEDGTVLIIPLKIKQNMAIWRFTVINNKRKAEQTPMHSVLYVKKFNSTGYVMGRVFSYAPSRQYIKKHPKYKNEMDWYNPDHTDYSGLLLISFLEGNLSHGFNYENGHRQYTFRPNVHAHNHDHEHESLPVTRAVAVADSCQHGHAADNRIVTARSTVFNMRIVSSTSAISTYSFNNETTLPNCAICGKDPYYCDCLIVDGEKCEECEKLIQNCTCTCEKCNRKKLNCICCLVCESYPCICHNNSGTGSENGGDGSNGGNNNSSNNGNNNNQGGSSVGGGNNNTPTPQLPSYSTLSIKFNEVAHMESSDVYEKIGGNVLNNHQINPTQFNNACALRICYALNFSSANIPYEAGKTISGDANNDGTSEWYYYKVVDLANYLNRTYSQCERYEVETTTPSEIKGRTGIICYQKCQWSDATGHIDIWEGNKSIGTDYNDVCDTVYFWELK